MTRDYKSGSWLIFDRGDISSLIEKIKFYLYEDIQKENIKMKNLQRIEDFIIWLSLIYLY